MRRSPKRTTLAVLREKLGLTQEKMGKLIGLARPSLQAIELGKARLTEENAAKLAVETGVSFQWLVEGNTRKKIVPAAVFGPQETRYSKAFFEQIQAAKAALAESTSEDLALIAAAMRKKAHEDFSGLGEDLIRAVESLGKLDLDQRSSRLQSEWSGVLAAARSKGQQEVAEYLFSQFIEDMKKRFGYEPEVIRKAANDTSE
jgi:transcriptional regulator with XRE-family HTH domain